MERRAQTDVIYTDLSAAFDKVNHDIELAKMGRFGINGSLLRWFHSYLTNLSELVKHLPSYPLQAFPKEATWGH